MLLSIVWLVYREWPRLWHRSISHLTIRLQATPRPRPSWQPGVIGAACQSRTVRQTRFKNERERLARLIAKGKLHYIWVHGVLGWGLASATLVAAWELISKGRITKEVIMPFIILPLSGILWGDWMWRFIQRRYEKTVGDAQNQ